MQKTKKHSDGQLKDRWVDYLLLNNSRISFLKKMEENIPYAPFQQNFAVDLLEHQSNHKTILIIIMK